MNELQPLDDEFRHIFNEAPVSLWVEDFSDAKKIIDRLRTSGVDNLRAHFESHPETVSACAKAVKVIQVNKTTLDMYKADNEKQLFEGIDKTFTEESYEVFREELIALAEGKTSVASEAVTKTLTGEPVHILIRISIMPGHEDTWSRLLVSMNDITEQKQAENALKSSEQKYRALIEHSNDAIFIADAETATIIEVNRKAEELTGLPREKLIGMHQSKLHPSEDAGTYKERFQTRAIRGKVVNDDIVVQHSDGHKILVNVSASRIEMNGKTLVLGVFRDVTEYKKGIDALRASEEKYRALVENINDAIFLADAEAGFILDVNHQAEVLTGLPREKLIGMHQSALHPEGEAEKYKEAFQRHIQMGGGVFPEIMQVQHRDGRNIPVEINAGLINLGGKTMIIGVFRDITERKRAKDQLRRVNRTLRMISDCNQALVRVSDEQRLLETICTLIVDEGGYKMAWVGEAKHDDERRVIPLAQAGFEEGYLESVHISWADNKFGRGPSGRAIREGNFVVCQDVLYDPAFLPWRDQAIRQGYASTVAFPLTVNGKAMGTLNIYASEPNAFHADEIDLLGELAGDLAFGIEVLRNRQARDVLEEQFVQAQKMEAIGTLTGGIAHDFNNMLAGMLGTVYLVRDTLKDHPDVQEKLKLVEKTGFRAAEMISKLLTFARKGSTDMQPVAFTPFLKEVFKLMRSSVPENIRLTLDVSETVLEKECTVKGDATLLQQVFLNLIDNAKHAVTARSHPEIRVSLDIPETYDTLWKRHPDILDKPCVRLTVRDNGYGIAEEVRDKLFDPFFTTKEVGEGTGLGLAMVYGAVQSHDGVIEVESEEGKGSAFHIFLPLAEQAVLPSRGEDDQVAEGHGETVLLADDEASVCEVCRELLESMGYHVLIASNGEEAVSLFEKHRDEIRLAILDVVMPQMGGVDAAMKMRESHPDLPILFQTGYGEEQVREGMQSLKPCRVVTKPALIPELSRTLRELLDKKEVDSASADS